MTDPGSDATGSEIEERPPSRWMGRLLLGMGVGCLAAVGLVTAVVGKYVRDDWVLDGVVRAVALDWRDFGEERARERLQFELDRRGIGTHVRDDSCALSPAASGSREVLCAWTVPLDIPVVDRSWPLRFESRAVIAADGDLR